ncbi:dynein axonemal assembly factor 3-like [Dysidea avara]|uniref:dynein axonemal assembly factor 3-like n=1 Tax=Dysidea avara TaxID=196820 RepID=UPI003323B1FB
MASSGLGYITWWGYSPALDLINLTGFDGRRNLVDPAEHVKGDDINILLIGAADLRHVLLTMANNLATRNVHFYMIESSLEVLARHMLFLSLCAEPPGQLGNQEKAEMFIELYGNIMLRSQALEYVIMKSNDLIKCVTDDDYLKQHLPQLDISLLKFKEKDFLEGIFKFWRNSDQAFDIKKMWESRVRSFLGARYDSRSGVFDWDYNMKLLDMVSVINNHEYCGWRDDGIAFRLRPDAPYEAPNITLASGIVVNKNGEKVGQRGYWGDIVTSPYITFGTATDNDDLLKAIKDKRAKGGQDITVHNVSIVTSNLSGELTKKDLSSGSPPKVIGKISNNFTVSLLPLGTAAELGKKKKFSSLFDVVYFSNSMVHHLTSDIKPALAPDCIMVAESAKFMLELKKENKQEYVKKVTAMASAVGLKPIATTSQIDESLDHLFYCS